MEIDILSKFVGFFRGLRSSPSPEVSFMAFMVGRDLRTTTGRNLRLLQSETGLDPWTESPAAIRKTLAKKHVNVPACDGWRVPYLGLLLQQRQTAHYSGLEDEEKKLNEMIE